MYRFILSVSDGNMNISVSSEIDDSPAGTAWAEDPLWKAIFAFQS